MKSGDLYHRTIFNRTLLLIGLFVFLLWAALYSAALGVAQISFVDTCRVLVDLLPGSNAGKYSPFTRGVILYLRLPRIFLAAITGIVLGASGVIMQSILRNPLASPYTLGISSGSAFGAALAIVMGELILGRIPAAWLTIAGAFTLGVLTIVAINGIASLRGGGASMLILAGVALGYLFSSGVSFLRYITDHEELRELTVWLMGGFYRAEWKDVAILAPVMLIGLFLLLHKAWDVNALSAGEEVAQNLGINVRGLRKYTTVVASFITSCVVAFTGIIGFVGLVAPHICRMFLGNDNRFLIPGSGLLGAILLLGADTAARLIINPSELPVGIITSAVGAPFFLYLLIRKRRNYWS